MQSRLSVENPGKLQILLEDGVSAVVGLLEDWIGPKGRATCRSSRTLGLFILLGNYMGLVPGLMAPTSSINVTLGLRADDLGLLPLPGHQEQGVGRLPQALRGAAGRAALDGAAHAADRADQPHVAACCRCRCVSSATSSAKSWSS